MSKIKSFINKRKIKVALVGCGRISSKHFDAIESHNSDMELVAICDIDEERLKIAKERTGVAAFPDYLLLLTGSGCDLVILCTPSGIHATQTKEAARYSKHVMTEKPMATRWQDGCDMVEHCDNAGVWLFVVKQNRYNSTLQLLKKTIHEGKFGKIYMSNINVFWTRPQEYYDKDSWRGTWEFDGGALMNQASHYVDLLDWLIGPVESVQALTGTLARNIEVEDTAVMNVKWRSGAIGSMSVTMLAYPRNIEGSIIVMGEKGTAKVGGVAVNKVDLWEFEDETLSKSDAEKASYETISVYGFGHSAYYRNVINTMRGTEQAETDGREGLRSLEILISAYMSARDGKRISLPLLY